MTEIFGSESPRVDGRYLFEAHIKNGTVETYGYLGVAPSGATARVSTVAEAAVETRVAIARAYERVEALPTEFYGPVSDAITEIIACYQSEAISRSLAMALSFTDAPSYDSVLILPDEWIHGVGEEKPNALM